MMRVKGSVAKFGFRRDWISFQEILRPQSDDDGFPKGSQFERDIILWGVR
jgi:hypothetical protein